MTDNIAVEVMAQLTTLDPQLRARVMRLANMALDEAERTLVMGDPRSKQMVMRGFVQAVTKHLSHSEQNDEVEALRKEMETLRELVIGRVPGEIVVVNDEVEGGVEVDRPRT